MFTQGRILQIINIHEDESHASLLFLYITILFIKQIIFVIAYIFARSVGAELNVLPYCSQFIPMDVILHPKYQSIIYHPSILPRHRGASAINWFVYIYSAIFLLINVNISCLIILRSFLFPLSKFIYTINVTTSNVLFSFHNYFIFHFKICSEEFNKS